MTLFQLSILHFNASKISRRIYFKPVHLCCRCLVTSHGWGDPSTGASEGRPVCEPGWSFWVGRQSAGEGTTTGALAAHWQCQLLQVCGNDQFLTHWPLVDFNLILVNGGWGISYEFAFRWMPLDLTDDKSTLVQVMAWCRHATSHYLSQCWPRSMPPNGITRPQWVNVFW